MHPTTCLLSVLSFTSDVKVYLESHGCAMNYGEGMMMMQRMLSHGVELSESPERAEMLVLNTCGVIEFTERAMFRRIAEFASTGRRVVVTGCLAKTHAAEISAMSPLVSVLPPMDMKALGTVLGLNFDSGMDCWSDLGRNDIIVPIAQGCISACTYCYSRLSRGRVRSLPPSTILQMVRRHVEGGGVREIFLSAMDAIAYGRDIGTDLPGLLQQISSLEGNFRIRVGMMNPSLVPPLLDRLIDAFSDRRIYRFFHLPLQSGSDRILKAMRRGYTSAQFLELVSELRRHFPEMTLSTDVITGFPCETDEDFQQTLETLQQASPDIVNVTRFSAREGTRAYAMPQVPGWISKERSRKATAVRFCISSKKNRLYEGREYDVLVTERGKGNTSIGRLDNYKQVVIDGIHEPGTIMRCIVTGSSPVHLLASPLQ